MENDSLLHTKTPYAKLHDVIIKSECCNDIDKCESNGFIIGFLSIIIGIGLGITGSYIYSLY